jgi:hypothetical protein
MNRQQQIQRIARVRRSIITGSVLSSLGLAGYLGVSAQSANATDDSGTTNSGTTTSDTGSTGTSTGTGTDSSSYSDTYGDNSTQVTSGSGSSHATTSGS